MPKALLAGLAYFTAAFLAGMLLGTVRLLALEPKVGAVAAVLIELPIILAFTWWTCGRVMERLRMPLKVGPALAMGGMAFLLLMAADAGLALWMPDRSATDLLAQYRQPAAILGLLGQLLFAFFPLLQVGRARVAKAMS